LTYSTLNNVFNWANSTLFEQMTGQFCTYLSEKFS
jgi:hypothetical protein